mmetsp:Transcript_25339/g.84941  ORF Transcript_25339/g.84941 Transcript_25339/m.84941 type:complete len:214 (+) Transcript_25339:1177-1818(+)
MPCSVHVMPLSPQGAPSMSACTPCTPKNACAHPATAQPAPVRTQPASAHPMLSKAVHADGLGLERVAILIQRHGRDVRRPEAAKDGAAPRPHPPALGQRERVVGPAGELHDPAAAKAVHALRERLVREIVVVRGHLRGGGRRELAIVGVAPRVELAVGGEREREVLAALHLLQGGLLQALDVEDAGQGAGVPHSVHLVHGRGVLQGDHQSDPL